MPFQVSLHSSTSSRGVINSFTAGVDQFATCATEVILTAVVDGNLGGHTTWWEQISGDTQIVWLTPQNQLEATFAVIGGGSSDRIFRFYIDKGTPLEQYDDVTTWGTPTSILINSCSLGFNAITTDVDCRNVSCSSIYTWYMFPTPSVEGSSAINPTTNFAISWSWPTCDLLYLKDVTISYNNGPIVVLDSVSPPAPASIPIPDVYGVYYFNVSYEIESNTYTQFSCRHQQVNVPNTQTAYITDTYSQYSNRTSQQTTYYELSQNQDPLSIDVTPYSNSGSYQVTVYYELTNVDNADVYNPPLNVINNGITVVYYSNNGIGG